MSRLINFLDILQNMGIRYTFYRIYYEFLRVTGILTTRFPTKYKDLNFESKNRWLSELPPFFISGKEDIGLQKEKVSELEERVSQIKKGYYQFFNHEIIHISDTSKWNINPTNGFEYNSNDHWTKIKDFDQQQGDIKYVWERARFTFLYDLIRYDYHFEKDQSEFVFGQIENFIDNNPINLGPNYKCSQEISLRILNWTYCLYYYKDSKLLNDELLNKIFNSIYRQIEHVYMNINFSRYCVRNNHAITETMMLYLSGLLFPFFPRVKNWSKKGKKWFEQEVSYQIYEDGSYLQHSMNYHRVVVQLLTWGIQLSHLNSIKLSPKVYDRANKSLKFLDTCLDQISGCLPNYGTNDGALFFKFTDDDYSVFLTQLDDLRGVLKNTLAFESNTHYWYGLKNLKKESIEYQGTEKFTSGGYYLLNEGSTKTFIRCAEYKDRPFQCDELHLDVWHNGINYLIDSGTFKYNTTDENIEYFNGCIGHNTISIDGKNQMKKGSRFVWYNWVKRAGMEIKENENEIQLIGWIKAYKELEKNIRHYRTIIKQKGINSWNVQDKIKSKNDRNIFQYWHVLPENMNKILFDSKDKNGNPIIPVIESKWYSRYYGSKEEVILFKFATKTKEINTKITII